MTSKANTKNMSSMDCSYEQHSGSDSDSSFSEDFSDIGGRGAENVEMIEVPVEKKLQAEDLSNGKYKCFMLQGELFNDDDEVGCFWEDAENLTTYIKWRVCDLKGNDGICADDISEGLAFWNDEHKCYHSSENFTDNEQVYRILAIEKKDSKKKAE